MQCVTVLLCCEVLFTIPLEYSGIELRNPHAFPPIARSQVGLRFGLFRS